MDQSVTCDSLAVGLKLIRVGFRVSEMIRYTRLKWFIGSLRPSATLHPSHISSISSVPPHHWLKYFRIPDVNHVTTSLTINAIIKILTMPSSGLSYSPLTNQYDTGGVPRLSKGLYILHESS